MRARARIQRSAGCGDASERTCCWREAGGRRGCQSHVNLQFSCSFFLQGEGTPNGRLRERAGRWYVVAARDAMDSALGEDCGRVRNCSGRCGPGSCSWDRQLKVDGGGFHGFDGVAEIFRLRWSRGSCGGGAGAQRGCGVGRDCCASSELRTCRSEDTKIQFRNLILFFGVAATGHCRSRKGAM